MLALAYSSPQEERLVEKERKEALVMLIDMKINDRFITKRRVATAFFISMVLIFVAMLPTLIYDLDVSFVKYLWIFCSVVMFYFCFLKKDAHPKEDIGGAVIIIILSPAAIISLLVFYLLAKHAERSEKCSR